MSEQKKVSGVVLAGGQASRMQYQDKGLMVFKGKHLISYPLAAMSPLVDELIISANRHLDIYADYAAKVVSDHNQHFDGPLAGILAAMQIAEYPLLLIMPCDSPLIETDHLQRLLSAMSASDDAVIAFDGERLHPVVMILRTCLQESLSAYLNRGERKMQLWLQQIQTSRVDFSDVPQIFANINTLTELQALESEKT
jgi:molybdopterin-guanine dinucleotide biosynthesis protein A